MAENEEPKPKKAKKQSAPKPPATKDALIQHALTKVVTDPKAKWLGKSAAALFNEKDENHQAAITECTNADRPYLRKVGECGTLTVEGVVRLLELSPKDEVSARLSSYVATASDSDRAELISALESRTSGPHAELFSAAVNTLEAEEERKAAERSKQAKQATLARHRQKLALLRDRAARLADESATCHAEIAGAEATIAGLEAAQAVTYTTQPAEAAAQSVEKPNPTPQPPLGSGPEPKTDEEKDFFRLVGRRLVSAWLETVRLNMPDGQKALQVAFDNLERFEPIGESGQRVAFDGAQHRCDSAVSTGAAVTVVRPGWKLNEGDGDYTIEKALVKT